MEIAKFHRSLCKYVNLYTVEDAKIVKEAMKTVQVSTLMDFGIVEMSGHRIACEYEQQLCRTT